MPPAIGTIEVGLRRHPGRGGRLACRDGVLRSAPARERDGEPAMFQAGCHAMLASVAGRPGSGIAGPERSSEEEAAMGMLRRIIESGYNDQELNTESSLDPLRSRPDFQLLMMRRVLFRPSRLPAATERRDWVEPSPATR